MFSSRPAQTTITGSSPSLWQYLNPLHLTRNLWHHRYLILQLTRREIEGRYKGSFLGLFWSFINPLVLLLIYTFVFGIVFKARWPNARVGNLGEFAITLFCGLIVFTIFSECVGRAPTLIVGVPNYVKKIIFPLEILPIITFGAALFHAGISLIILLVANFFISGEVSWTSVCLPLIILPLIGLSLGLTWFLASLGVFIRDINYTVTLIVQVLFFLTPIFYALENIPERYQIAIGFNPLAQIVENARRVLLWGILPDWGNLVLSIVVSGAIMLLGYAWFMKTKKGFADVI